MAWVACEWVLYTQGTSAEDPPVCHVRRFLFVPTEIKDIVGLCRIKFKCILISLYHRIKFECLLTSKNTFRIKYYFAGASLLTWTLSILSWYEYYLLLRNTWIVMRKMDGARYDSLIAESIPVCSKCGRGGEMVGRKAWVSWGRPLTRCYYSSASRRVTPRHELREAGWPGWLACCPVVPCPTARAALPHRTLLPAGSSAPTPPPPVHPCSAHANHSSSSSGFINIFFFFFGWTTNTPTSANR